MPQALVEVVQKERAILLLDIGEDDPYKIIFPKQCLPEQVQPGDTVNIDVHQKRSSWMSRVFTKKEKKGA